MPRPLDRRAVAEGVDVGVVHRAQPGIHLHLVEGVGGDTELGEERCGFDAGRPHHHRGVDHATVGEPHRLREHLGDAGVAVHLHVQFIEHAASGDGDALGQRWQDAR